MPDTTNVTTDQTSATGSTPATPPTDPAATTVNPGLQWLETADPDEIARNPRIAGILGSRLQKERENIRRELASEREAHAREAAEQELLDLAKRDQFAFAERYLSKAEQDRLAKEAANLKQSTRTEFAAQLGRGYSALPEWSQLSPTEQETLAKSVAGKADDEAVIAFNAAAIDVIAERRATKKVASFRETELGKEREAIRQEEAAKRLKTSARPSIQRTGSDPQAPDPTKLSDKEFTKWYEANVLSNIGQRR